MSYNLKTEIKQPIKTANALLLSLLVLLFFTVCLAGCGTAKYSRKSSVSFQNLGNISVLDSINDDSLSLQLLKPYKDSLSQQLSETIAFIDSPFYNAFFTGNLGRLAADYMLITANAYAQREFGIPCHFAISNNGGFRTGLYKGNVTLQNIFEIMPFENDLVLVQLPGLYVDSLFRYISQLQGTPASGIVLEYSKGISRKENQFTSAKINGNTIHNISDVLKMECSQPFDSRRDYLIAINSYMAVGGDGFTMLKHAKRKFYTGINLRNILADQLRAEYQVNRFIEPRKTVRIYPVNP